MIQLAFPGLPEPIGPPTKRCAHCLERKALGRCSLDLSRPNGLCRICRDCDGVRYRALWRANAERMRARQRQRYAAILIEYRKRNAQRRRSTRQGNQPAKVQRAQPRETRGTCRRAPRRTRRHP